MILAMISFLGCERPIEIGRTTGQEKVVTKSCKTSGYCWHYDYNKGEYKWGHSYGCDGKRQVTVREDLVGYHYKSNKKPDFVRKEEVRINYLTDCER